MENPMTSMTIEFQKGMARKSTETRTSQGYENHLTASMKQFLGV
jgi:hypothetical protein